MIFIFVFILYSIAVYFLLKFIRMKYQFFVNKVFYVLGICAVTVILFLFVVDIPKCVTGDNKIETSVIQEKLRGRRYNSIRYILTDKQGNSYGTGTHFAFLDNKVYRDVRITYLPTTKYVLYVEIKNGSSSFYVLPYEKEKDDKWEYKRIYSYLNSLGQIVFGLIIISIIGYIRIVKTRKN